MFSPQAQIARTDRWKPWNYRGRQLLYLLLDFGNDTPIVRLFERGPEREYYLRHAATHGRVLGRGKVTYYPDTEGPHA